jgi:hypothetical protein
VQVAEFKPPVVQAMPIAGALRAAGTLMHAAAQSGLLSRDYMVSWLGHSFRGEDRTAFLRDLLDVSNHVHVPVAAGGGDGWWFQITRRLLWLTKATEEHRLLESLLSNADDALQALVAVEPLLIAGRLTSHPVDWAMAFRIWPSVERPGAMTRHPAPHPEQHARPANEKTPNPDVGSGSFRCPER